MVNGTRHHFLAGAGFARDQDRTLGLRHELGTLDHVLHRAAAPDDAVVIELGIALADQVLALGAEPLVIERVADQRDQLLDLERLLQVVERPELHRLDGALHRGMGGHHQHLRPFGRRHRLRHLPNQLEACHARHQVIDDQKVEGLLDKLLLGVSRRRRFNDLVPFVTQRAPEPLENLLLVVGEQNRASNRAHACTSGG